LRLFYLCPPTRKEENLTGLLKTAEIFLKTSIKSREKKKKKKKGGGTAYLQGKGEKKALGGGHLFLISTNYCKGGKEKRKREKKELTGEGEGGELIALEEKEIQVKRGLPVPSFS